MTKRMKCKLCFSIIESVSNEIICCKCGELTLDGVTKSIFCSREDSYVEVDEHGHQIVSKDEEYKKPRTEELLRMLNMMIKNIEDLPIYTMSSPINHYDLLSALLLISSIFKSISSNDKLIK